jgi:iron complex outermembrane receptor protein
VVNSRDFSAVTAEWPKGALRQAIYHRRQQVIQIRRALLLFFLLPLSFSLNSALAVAQDGPEDESPELENAIVIEEVFVTGSLLPKGDFVSKAPVATISSTQFEMSNTTNVEALINSMPQVVGGADRSSTFGQGIATANLRGLGENRTLVLINSRRFVPTFPDGGTVDLNFIPVGLIDRVEVLTGGASAAYGSDALAGVINFILKEETDGWEINAGAEITERGDSEIYNFNITNGGTFADGKGKYLVHADLLDREPTMFTDRRLTSANLIDVPSSGGGLELGVANNRYPLTLNASGFNPAIGGDGFGGVFLFDNNGNANLASFSTGAAQAALGVSGGDSVTSLNGFSYLQLPQERKSFKGQLSYDFGSVEPYVDIYYSESEVPQVFNGAFMGYPNAFGYTTTVEDNPFWSDQAKASMSMISAIWDSFIPGRTNFVDSNQNGIAETLKIPFLYRTFVDMGPATNDRIFESLQVEFGLRGQLSQSWGYDVFVQIGEVESSIDQNPLLNPAKVQQALLVTADGQCTDPSDNCVPLNLWSDDIGQAAADFIRYPEGSGTSITRNKQNVFMGTISGNTAGMFSLPGDPGPIGVVLGFEYRKLEALIDTPRFIEQGLYEGGVSYYPYSLDESVDFKNIIAEAVVPLVSGKPGIDFLELELGLRSSEHSITGRDNTYKIAVSYYPTPDLQLRASFNKANRSPSIDELFKYSESLAFLNDPCTDPFLSDPSNTGPYSETPELAATCIATGVPEENLYNAQYKALTAPRDLGGNPNLSSEDASTYSIGFVFTPYALESLSVSFDYFRVEIEDYIELTPVTSNDLMFSCYDLSLGRGGPGSPACNAVRRDADGRINSLFTGYQNLGLHVVEGFDVNIEYGFEFLSGYLDINYFATKLLGRTIEDDTYGDVDFDCLGYFNGDCDNLIDYPVFDFKHRMTLGWSREDIDLQLVWRYTSALDDGNDEIEYFRETISAYSLFDLSGRYQLNDQLSLTFGVKNIFDKEPQAIGSNSWEWLREDIGTFSNTYTQYYDVFGRTMFLRLSAQF